jgi:replicative DNA helicase
MAWRSCTRCRSSSTRAGALTVTEIRARARRLKRQYTKLGLIVIDYLQLMESSSEEDLRAQALGEITRSLKAMGKELDVPVLLLSQLNRAVEQRPDKRPGLADLRDSGAIEQDADVVLFLYRDEYYHPEGENKGVAEAIIGKQRNGPTGTVLLTWLGQYTRFENYADPAFDGSSYKPHRGARGGSGKVKNFSDFKQAAGGPDAA